MKVKFILFFLSLAIIWFLHACCGEDHYRIGPEELHSEITCFMQDSSKGSIIKNDTTIEGNLDSFILNLNINYDYSENTTPQLNLQLINTATASKCPHFYETLNPIVKINVTTLLDIDKNYPVGSKINSILRLVYSDKDIDSLVAENLMASERNDREPFPISCYLIKPYSTNISELKLNIEILKEDGSFLVDETPHLRINR